MKYIALIPILFWILPAFSQSKKQINRQLNLELFDIKSKYDSITNLALEKGDGLLAKQTGFKLALKRNEQRQATNLNDALGMVEKEYERFIRLGKNPGKLVNLDDLEIEIRTFQGRYPVEEIPQKMLEWQRPVFLEDAPEVKGSLKIQNERLRNELTRYSKASVESRALINTIDDYSKTIEHTRPLLDSVYLGYEQVLYDLAVGQAILIDTIQKLREWSLKNWPKNFTSAFEREFGKPERNEISQPTDDGSKTNVYYSYTGGPAFTNFIRYANPIPIHDFSMNAMNRQGQVNRSNLLNPGEAYAVVDELAEFPGGQSEMIKFLRNNFHVPAIAEEMGVSGKIWVKFTVKTDGTIVGVRITKGINECPECDQEAIRVVKKMPNWTPGKMNGKVVNSWYQLPIIIHIQ